MSAELLKQSILFKDFTPVGLQILGRIARPRVVLSGKPLFSEGAEADALYVILEGRFQILVRNAEGRDVPVASLGPGEHLADMSLLSLEKPVAHLCTAVAELDGKVIEIGRADFKNLMKDKPQACMKLLLAISQEFGLKMADSRDALRHLVARAIR